MTYTFVSHCYQEGHKSSECPVCSHPLNILGRPLPYAHCAQSRLVCPMSGHIMNENNPPMVLPNGYVYGENVSLDPFVIAFFWFFNWLSAVWTQQSYELRGQEAKKKRKENFIQFYMTWLTADHCLSLKLGKTSKRKLKLNRNLWKDTKLAKRKLQTTQSLFKYGYPV